MMGIHVKTVESCEHEPTASLLLDGRDTVWAIIMVKNTLVSSDDGADRSIVGREGKSKARKSIYSNEDKTLPLP